MNVNNINIEINDIPIAQKYIDIFERFEINPKYFSDLNKMIENYTINIIVDSSGSMNSRLTNPYVSPYSNKYLSTRWNELCDIVTALCELALNINMNINIISFNNNIIKSINNMDDINYFLSNTKVGGRTPLTQTFHNIKLFNKSTKTLYIVATDGAPTKFDGSCDKENFKNEIFACNKINEKIMFLICSDEKDDVEYLDEIDRKLDNVDTLDDFQSEYIQVTNKNNKYTFGDHLARLLVGAVYSKYDKLDEKKVNENESENNCCCIIL